MNKKTLIQVVIIICAFAASGIVLYNGLFKNSSGVPDSSLTIDLAASTEKILPYGDKMDIKSAVSQQNLQYGLIQYPKLDPNQEVGIPLQQLIVPPAITTTN